MEREILFRGKPMFRESNDFVYGYYKQDDIAGVKTDFILPLPEYKNEINEVAVCPLTVGQFTGLTDRNGVKIFEGDIVTGTAYSFERTGVIVWIDEIAGFGIKYPIRKYAAAWENASILKQLYKGRNDQFAAAVIGNVHDNPELMKGEENV